MARLLPLSVLLCGLVASLLPAQDMLGVSWNGDAYTVDSNTGFATYLGATGVAELNAMARNGQGRLYVADNGSSGSSRLYLLDPATGQATFAVQTTVASIRGLAFVPGGTLYAVDHPGFPFGTNDLYTIDLGTGVGTYVGRVGSYGVQGLAYGLGRLWGWSANTGGSSGTSGSGLIVIDPFTAQASDVNPNDVGLASQVQTLCFDDLGALYGMRDTLYVVNMNTGALTTIGGTGVSDLRGLEFTQRNSGLFLQVTGSCGGAVEAFASGATAGRPVALFYCHAPGSGFTVPSGRCAGALLDLAPSAQLANARDAGPLGQARFGPVIVPSGACGRTRLQALDIVTCGKSNVVTL